MKFKKKVISVIKGIILLNIILLIGCTQNQVEEVENLPQDTKAILSIKSSSESISIGDEFKLDIEISDAKEIAGVELDITYDSSIFDYIKTEEGSFFSQESNTLFLDTIDTSKEGLIKDIIIVRLNGGTSGGGVIASIYFDAINSGSSDINFGEVLIGNSKGEPVNSILENIKISVN